MKQQFGKKDIVFLGGLLILGVILTAAIYLYSGKGRRICVMLDGKVYGTYDLSEDQEISIDYEGRPGNVIVITEGQAKMKEANCPDGLCMHQGAISREKQTIVCLPHRLVVEVIGGEEEEYDSISG